MKRSLVALVAVTLLALTGTSLCAQGQLQNQATRPARSRAEETVEWWNQIGNKLIAMAKDFPEEKYDFITAIEHSTEHFGQLVVYYRANNLVPPESRR